MNKKIKLLTAFDILSLYGISLLTPIFSVFVVEEINGGNLKTVGYALGINLVVSNILNLVFAKYFDRTKGDRDEYTWLFIGYVFLSFIPAFYIFASHIWHIYALQFLNGLFVAISFPAWRALYSRSIDKGQEAFEWSFNMTLNGLTAASAAFLSGIIANKFGYNYVFIIAPIIGLPGIIALIRARKLFIK